MSNRRTFIQTVASLPVIGSLFPASLASAAVAKRDYFKELNVGTFINAAGTYTTLTASLMHPKSWRRSNMPPNISCGLRIYMMPRASASPS